MGTITVKRILVLGAGGQLGVEVIKEALERGHLVSAFVRAERDFPYSENLRTILGDAMNHQDILIAAKGHDAVVNAIGSGTILKNTVESATTAIALKAVEDAGVRRYIAMSAGMVAHDALFVKLLRTLLLRNLYREHLRVEKLVGESPLDWTIVRPARLTNRPPTNYALASLDPIGEIWSNSRADVAQFIVSIINNNQFVRQAVFVA